MEEAVTLLNQKATKSSSKAGSRKKFPAKDGSEPEADGFATFTAQRKKELRKSSGGPKAAELAAILADEWSMLSAEAQQGFQQANGRQKPKQKASKAPSSKAATSRKSKPLSGYNLFCKERRQDLKGDAQSADMKPTEVMKLLGSEWSALTPKEKEGFSERAKHIK